MNEGRSCLFSCLVCLLANYASKVLNDFTTSHQQRTASISNN